MQYKLVIFDCDGTLVDTAFDVAQCFADALQRCGYPRCEYDSVTALLGKPLPRIMSGLLPPEVDKGEVNRVSNAYKEIYAACPKENTVLYPGMGELVDSLLAEGIAVAVNSNKPEAALRELIAKLLPGREIAIAGLVEYREPKPSPEAAVQFINEVGCQSCEAIYVGDTSVDIETATAANMPCLLVGWGPGDELLRGDDSTVYYVDGVDELCDFLRKGC